jgi:hypothetical protein
MIDEPHLRLIVWRRRDGWLRAWHDSRIKVASTGRTSRQVPDVRQVQVLAHFLQFLLAGERSESSPSARASRAVPVFSFPSVFHATLNGSGAQQSVNRRLS